MTIFVTYLMLFQKMKFTWRFKIMTRQGLPTGQMQEETKELLDEYNEEYCWEYMIW